MVGSSVQGPRPARLAAFAFNGCCGGRLLQATDRKACAQTDIHIKVNQPENVLPLQFHFTGLPDGNIWTVPNRDWVPART